MKIEAEFFYLEYFVSIKVRSLCDNSCLQKAKLKWI